MSAGESYASVPASEWVRRQLHYEPRDAGLFEQALRHRSAARNHNERLEFLGDAVLNLIVARYLYSAVSGFR